MIETVETPLVRCGAEALLRPVRTDWTAITTAGRELEVEAGERWREKCRSQGELPLGSAAITDAGDLAASFVIHAAVTAEEGGATPRSVTLALRNGLRRAREWDVRDLALPLLGTGPGALDAETACRIMDPLLSEFDAGGERRVRVCVPEAGDRPVAVSRWPFAGAAEESARGDVRAERGRGGEGG